MCGVSKKPSVQKLWRERANMQMSWSSPRAVFAHFRDQRNAGTTRRVTGQSRVASPATYRCKWPKTTEILGLRERNYMHTSRSSRCACSEASPRGVVHFFWNKVLEGYVSCSLSLSMPPTKVCEHCSASVHIRKSVCACGHVFGSKKSSPSTARKSKLENLAQSQITLHAPTHQLIFFIVILSLCVQWAKVTPLRLCDGSHSFALALKCKTLGTLRLFIILGRYCVCVNSVCWPCFVGQCLTNISLVSGLLRQLLVSDAAFDRAVIVPTLFENPQIK